MKEIIRDVLSVGPEGLSFKVPMLIYNDAQEADLAAGKQDAFYWEAINNLLYRGTYADARNLIEEVVFEQTQVPFIMVDTGEKDDKGLPILERDTKDSTAKYVNRAFASGKLNFEKAQAEVTKRSRGWEYKDDAGNLIKVPALATDIKATERKAPGPKKLAQKFKDNALLFLQGKMDINKFIKAVKTRLNVDFVLPDPKTPLNPINVEPLGWVIKRHGDFLDEKKRQEREAQEAKEFAV